MSTTAYDVVSYPCHPFAQTHPDRLAAIATMMGLSPTPVERCRVLELGCGDGGNLIPMAMTFPGSDFTGLDLAESGVKRGNAWIEELGLRNIALRAADVLDFPADAGEFDYILAHGLFSWVPAAVRDKIMAICRDHLAANGIAYISYNAMPGGHIHRMFREMMRFHVRDIDDPDKKVEQALSLLQFLDAGKAKDAEAYALLLKKELKQMTEKGAAVVIHDDLAEINEPYYFHEFMACATAHGLQYLAEADIVEMSDVPYPPAIRDMAKQMSETDPLLREQYLDFLKCRRFRQTLLVRNNLHVSRRLDPERLRGLSISSQLKPDSPAPSLAKGAKESFRVPNGGTMAIDLPLAKSAILHLGEMDPVPVRFTDLMAAARNRAGMPGGNDDESPVLEMLCQVYSVGLVDIHAAGPCFVRRAGEKPTASPLARLQLKKGMELVTSYRYRIIRVEAGLSRELIMRLDGTRDRKALLDDLTAWALANPASGQPPMEAAELRELFLRRLEPGLDSVGAMGLLLK
jgi:SAM-dependent methyltransferase